MQVINRLLLSKSNDCWTRLKCNSSHFNPKLISLWLTFYYFLFVFVLVQFIRCDRLFLLDKVRHACLVSYIGFFWVALLIHHKHSLFRRRLFKTFLAKTNHLFIRHVAWLWSQQELVNLINMVSLQSKLTFLFQTVRWDL